MLVDGGEAVEESSESVEEEFRLDEIMATEIKEVLRKEERLQRVRRESSARSPMGHVCGRVDCVVGGEVDNLSVWECKPADARLEEASNSLWGIVCTCMR